LTASTDGCASSPPVRVRIAREQITQLRALNRHIDQLHRELAELVAAQHPNLLAEQGCGALTAAILIGHTAGNQQFRKEASFAMKTGTPPVPCSSGQRTQHRLNRGGDRQLNHALHIIAITRAQRDPATKQYLARKEAEGKTSKAALRSLKRHLARRFHRLLAEPPADQQQTTNGQPTVGPQPAGSDDKPAQIPPPAPRPREVQRIDAAPALMVCIT
jgi:transposase